MSLHTDGIEYLSPSSAATMVECERRFWWRYARKLGKDERTEALAMGGGMATALETGDLARGIAEYHIRRPEADAFTDPVVYEREGWAAEATIREAYNGYIYRWPDHAAPGGVRREQTYMVDLPGTSRLLQVRIDGVSDEHLVEDKLRSASSMRDQDIESERLQGIQLTSEIYVHWRCTGDLLPVRFRNIKKCDRRKWTKLGTQAEVDEVIAAHFAGEVFFEWEVTRTEAQLEAALTDLVGLAVRADQLLTPSILGELPPSGRRNTKACHAFGRTCPALAHCQGVLTEDELLEQAGLAA